MLLEFLMCRKNDDRLTFERLYICVGQQGIGPLEGWKAANATSQNVDQE